MSLCEAKMTRISSNTSLGSLSELTLQFFYFQSKYLTISRVYFSQVTKRFLMLSILSSERPLVSPLLSSLSSITFSLHSKWRMKGTSTFSSIIFSQVLRFSRFLGKPSIRKRPPFIPELSIAFWRSMTVISLGTILPSTMYFSIVSPYCDPGCFLSALSKSPAERWTNLNSDWMRSLAVPLPEPGPPRMKTTVVSFVLINKFIKLLHKILFSQIFNKREEFNQKDACILTLAIFPYHRDFLSRGEKGD